IPDWLKHPVCKPERQDVLDRFLSEVMVDPVDLGFLKTFSQFAIERTRALEVVAERLLDDDTAPAVLLGEEPRMREPFAYQPEEIWRDREVEEVIRGDVVALANVRERLLQFVEQRGVV